MNEKADENPLLSEHEWKTKDPDAAIPDRKGMLLSDEIDRFASAPVHLLIAEHYSPKRLRPAAYTLTIGDKYVDNKGKHCTLTEDEPSFEMEPNSIVFVSIKERLDLPYYIAARFNLRVDWVYKGILLGTGPQVEPGFNGFLSCPLYNLTNRAITIKREDEFATIDFERTTNFVSKTPVEIAKAIRPDEKLDLYSDGERRLLLFRQKLMEPLKKYPTDYKIISSLDELSREVRTWRAIGIGIAVSFLALTLTLLGLHNSLLRDALGNSKDIIELKQKQDSTSQEIRSLAQEIQSLTNDGRGENQRQQKKTRGKSSAERVRTAPKAR